MEVLQTQQALFAEVGPGLSQLAQAIEKLATDQFEEMASAIRAFMKEYPPIRDRVVLVSNKGAGGGTPVENTPADEATLQEQLLNEIRVITPPPSPNKPNQDKK
ncbi:hypothetical protein BGP_2805 [Beggiatoa sp. PS]|nr:hypothetical protein BGP_2805 [Beggiatoa sp. PS]